MKIPEKKMLISIVGLIIVAGLAGFWGGDAFGYTRATNRLQGSNLSNYNVNMGNGRMMPYGRGGRGRFYNQNGNTTSPTDSSTNLPGASSSI